MPDSFGTLLGQHQEITENVSGKYFKSTWNILGKYSESIKFYKKITNKVLEKYRESTWKANGEWGLPTKKVKYLGKDWEYSKNWLEKCRKSIGNVSGQKQESTRKILGKY